MEIDRKIIELLHKRGLETDEEIAEFEEVLYTLRPSDAAGWSRSLTLRNINIPERLRDELIMLINGGQ